MAQVPAGPKGTRDFYPELMAFQQHIFDSWHATCRRYGFELFEGPMFECLELYTQKSGDEIEKQLYSFTDKGGRQVALRPELTPTLARMVASQGESLKKPIRWYSIPRLFRYERMQRGRGREFSQLNMDILGVEDVSADAELTAASIGMMQDLGFDHNDFSVLVSSRRLVEEYLLVCGVGQPKLPDFFGLLDRKAKMEPAQYQAELSALCGEGRVLERVRAVLGAHSLDDLAAVDASLPSLAQLRELFGLMQAYGLSDYVAFDMGVVRGLAYYTGIVFELFDRKKTLRAIAGGGRYDRLVKSYGGADTPAVGFAAGDMVLGELLVEKGLTPALPPRSSVFVACFEEGWPANAIAVAQELRRAGISAEFSLRRANIARQLRVANAARSPLVAFAGSEEQRQGRIKLKNMGSGAESTVPCTDLAAAVRRMLAERP